MAVDPFTFGKLLGGRLLSFAGQLVKAGLAKRRARNRAIRGEDLSSESSLEYMVKAELGKLATSSALPQVLQSDAVREWLTSDACAERFVETLIADAGGDPVLARRARDELATRYEQATGETRRLATGPLNLAVDYVTGQLRATEAATRAFDNALNLRIAAQLHALRYPDLRPFPTDADLERLQTVSARLLDAGRATWKMPAFIAPLTLEAHEEKDAKEVHPISTTQLVEAIEAGDSIILFGDGGIGKTTFLLELASLCTREAGRRAPLYVDAAIWARSGVGVLDYLAGTPPAQALGVTAGELAKLAEGGLLVLIVNGWNEIPAERKVYCRETFNILTTVAPSLAVVVASRTAHDTASLPSPRRIAVRGLTWEGQSAVLRSELAEDAADSLLEVLAKDTRLRHAARSPLILRGLIAQAQTGTKASANVYDLLGAVVATFEGDDKRELILAEAPVFGMQARYVEELACVLHARGATNLSRNEALSAIGTTAGQMVEERILGAVPHPAAVLDILASHHVLHVQDGLVRFAHQRFQEYFAAARLLSIGGQADDSMKLLCDAVNEPAWADSLELVAGKLKAPGGSGAARARLVQTAEAVDLAYACDLAGLCALAESDDAALHDRLVSRVNELSASPLTEVKELAIACKIASRLPAFADSLWALFESDEQQMRLHSHRLNGSPVSLIQLGPHAEARIKAWPSARRSEFLHEVASNSDNYDFIAGVAVADSDPDVRAAAISALFWNYPASTLGINAWLDAPLDVQTKHDLVGYVDYVLEQGVAGDRIREQLRVIAGSKISDDARLQLALAFPADVGPTAVDVVLDRLRNEVLKGNPGALISIVEEHAPDRLRALALDLVAGPRGTPEWVGDLLLGETPEVREVAFERAWEALQAGGVRRLSAELVGPLSSMRQTRRSIEAWLRHCVERRSKLSDAERERGREIERLLAHAPGDDLLGVVMELGTDASYEQSVELAEMLLTRVTRGEGQSSGANPWSPKPEQFTQFFDLVSNKSEEARSTQDRLFTLLACIASHVAPAVFGSLLLEALRRHLDAWTAYRALLDEWLKKPSSLRPCNPSLGNYVISALTRWGMDALPGVLQLLSHQNASDLVPQAIGRIASLPWASTRKQVFGSVNTDIQDSHQRRDAGFTLQQPSAAYQPTTDDAARALACTLNVEVDRQLAERETNSKWNVSQAKYQIGHLVGILANLPSAEIVAPVTRALGSGLLEMYDFVGAVRGLTRQGWAFSDADAVSEFETLYERETSSAWVHESTRYTLAEFSQLMFLVEPPTLLKLPLSHYLSQWQRFAHPSEVIRVLGNMRTERAWPALLALGKELSAKGQPPEEFVYALASALSSNHLAEFARLVADGTLFSWCRNAWTVERIAPAVAKVVKDAPDHLALLIDSCRKSASPLADALVGEVLSKLGGGDEKRLELGLEALDAGRASHANMPAYRMLEGMFTLKVPMSENQFEVYPKACNPLRQQLYRRAKVGGDAAIAAQRILASLECSRRESERPTDEPRHPELNDGLSWTVSLVLREALDASGLK
jgi:hypothetical protein